MRIAAALTAVLSTNSFADSAADEDRWADQVKFHLEQAESGVTITYEPETFTLHVSGGRCDGNIELDNYRGEALAHKRTPARVAGLIMKDCDDFQSAPTAILPCLRERASVEVPGNLGRELQWRRADAGTPSPFIYRPVGEVLALALCADRERTISRLTAADLADRKETFEQALTTATEALRSRPAPMRKEIRKGVYLFAGDDYAGTQVLLGEMWRDAPIKGEPVVAFVMNRLAILAGSEDAAGLHSLLQEVDQMRQWPHAWTPRVLRLHGDAWETFLAPRDPVVHRALAALALDGVRADYQLQHDALEGWLHSLGKDAVIERDEDAFNADVLVGQSKASGRIYTLATLPEGVDTTLPEVDWVVLGKSRLVPMSALKQAMGPRMSKTRFWPTRYRVTSFPSAEQLAALKPLKQLP